MASIRAPGDHRERCREHVATSHTWPHRAPWSSVAFGIGLALHAGADLAVRVSRGHLEDLPGREDLEYLRARGSGRLAHADNCRCGDKPGSAPMTRRVNLFARDSAEPVLHLHTLSPRLSSTGSPELSSYREASGDRLTTGIHTGGRPRTWTDCFACSVPPSRQAAPPRSVQSHLRADRRGAGRSVHRPDRGGGSGGRRDDGGGGHCQDGGGTRGHAMFERVESHGDVLVGLSGCPPRGGGARAAGR